MTNEMKKMVRQEEDFQFVRRVMLRRRRRFSGGAWMRQVMQPANSVDNRAEVR